MKNNSPLTCTWVFALCCATAYASGQDGDHPYTDTNGETYFLPDALVGPGIQPQCLTVGTAPSLPQPWATLRVRGDQLPVEDQITTPALCTFRTDVAQEKQQSWWMYRDVLSIGRIWNESLHRAFHVQGFLTKSDAEDRYSGLFLQNDNNDGMWIMNDGTPTGTRAFPNALQLLNAKGYAALGHLPGYLYTGTDPRGPWSRFHLFHNVTGTRPLFAHRTQMRNGFTLTGNSDHAYMGQWYDQGENGIGAEVDDHSNLVIAVSEQSIPEGHTHVWDNISFRHFSDLAQTTDGPASTVDGLEMMRIQPAREVSTGSVTPVEGMVGIGNFFGAPEGPPAERLDIENRTIRIRSMGTPGLYHNDGLNRVLVVDPTDGRVYWRDASSIGTAPAGGCEWERYPSSNRMTAAWQNPNTTTGCPEEDWLLGVGLQHPYVQAKLDVATRWSVGGAASAIRGTFKGDPHVAVQAAVVGRVLPETTGAILPTAFGVDASAVGMTTGSGVRGLATVDGTMNSSTWVDGTYGYVSAGAGRATVVSGARGEVDVTNTSITVSAAGTYGLIRVSNPGLPAVPASYGMFGQTEARGPVTFSYGGFGNSIAQSTGVLTRSIGLYGNSGANPGGLITNSYGVYGRAAGGGSNFGIYGLTPLTTPTDWAGYFVGNVNIVGTATCTANVWTSDASLKTDVETIANASELLAQVQPHTYRFLTETYPEMNLPTGTRMGVIAQEIETVLPNIVSEITMAPTWDTTGVELTPARTVKGVNYIELIPLLVAAFQEQSARIATLESDLASCCNNGERHVQAPSTEPGAIETDLRIIPNPIADQTELRYTVGIEGRVRLEITDAAGRIIQVQDEGSRTTGAYLYQWNTTLLAPGTYYCTLYVNDEPLVKKAVKLNAR